ncbi:hypothetical protein L195_g030286 [Trifolium pratense]|uniref:Uncharacterized protein n=1 Tax=Trifolium pratense TaxID=57577 RepID=A0A2K3L759_TRIPR|nr:hypothetical protein L195_g030286 [Trifolium pratense]
MEAKVEALESEIEEVRLSLIVVESAMKDMPVALVAMFEKSLRRSLLLEEESTNQKGSPSRKGPEKTIEKRSEAEGFTLQGDALTEFRQSVKVELPVFTGEDPAGWISCAEANPLTWEVLRDALLEWYGGHGDKDSGGDGGNEQSQAVTGYESCREGGQRRKRVGFTSGANELGRNGGADWVSVKGAKESIVGDKPTVSGLEIKEMGLLIKGVNLETGAVH